MGQKENIEEQETAFIKGQKGMWHTFQTAKGSHQLEHRESGGIICYMYDRVESRLGEGWMSG